MKTFSYTGFDASGRRLQGLVEAADPRSAREKLSSQGVFPEALDAVSGEATGSSARQRGFDRAPVRSLFYRELGSLLKSGLPVPQALGILLDSPDFVTSRSALARVRDRIRDGLSFTVALTECGSLTPFEQAVLESGEKAGSLELMLEELADYLEERERQRQRVVSAMIYPSIVAVIAAVVAVVMLGVMLPRFAAVWEEARVPIPALTKAVLWAGRWMFTLLLPACAVAGVAVWILRRRRLARGASGPSRWLRLPVVRDAAATLYALRFARTLSLLLKSGVPVPSALPLAGRATGHPGIAARLEVEAENVRHGESPAAAIRRIPILREQLAGWITAGEAGSDLAPMLDRASDRCRDRWDRQVTRALALVEPALILVMGAFVFLIALAVLLPILSLSRGLS